VDNQLKGTSAWLNLISGRDRQVPPGWAHERAAGDVSP
jgi:hypothetical protein